MKMKQVYIEFEKKIEVTAYVPEDMTDEAVRLMAEVVAQDGLRDWDDPDWQVYVGQSYVEEIADESLKLGPPNKYGYRVCLVPEFRRGDGALVASDDRSDLVQPEDATWWVKHREEV